LGTRVVVDLVVRIINQPAFDANFDCGRAHVNATGKGFDNASGQGAE
jgi:hypothetical protein